MVFSLIHLDTVNFSGIKLAFILIYLLTSVLYNRDVTHVVMVMTRQNPTLSFILVQVL